MITLQIASLKGRESSLKVCIASLIDQVDKVRVMLNGYDSIPGWISKNSKIEAHLRNNALMDGERFYLNETNEGYILFCDDDIKYPENFVQKLLQWYKWAWTTDKGKSIVSIMGTNMEPRPIKSYSMVRHEHYPAMGYISKVQEVDIIGMCGALTHSDYFKMTCADVRVMNSDINTSYYCNKNGISKYVIPHLSGWCEDLMVTLPADAFTIWTYNKPEKRDTGIVNFINENL